MKIQNKKNILWFRKLTICIFFSEMVSFPLLHGKNWRPFSGVLLASTITHLAIYKYADKSISSTYLKSVSIYKLLIRKIWLPVKKSLFLKKKNRSSCISFPGMLHKLFVSHLGWDMPDVYLWSYSEIIR